jgi:hypothetical protein
MMRIACGGAAASRRSTPSTCRELMRPPPQANDRAVLTPTTIISGSW